MRTGENESIARRLIQAWSAGGAEIIDTLAAPEINVFYSHFPQPIQGAKEFKAILQQTHTSFPDIHITVQEVVADGDQVVVFWSYQGTHRVGEVFGIAARGRKVHVSGVTRYRIDNGKVVDESGIVDNFSLIQQLSA